MHLRFPSVISTLVLPGLLALPLACSSSSGGGGGGSDDAGHVLDGVWFGTIEDSDGNITDLQVTIEDRVITRIVLDGDVITTVGTLELIAGEDRVYSTVLNDEGDLIDGGFVHSEGGEHIAYVGEDLTFALLERGATSLPGFQQGDVLGESYSGISVLVGPGFEFDSAFSSEVALAADGSFTGSDATGLDFVEAAGGELTLTSASFGVWDGRFEADDAGDVSTGDIRLFASADLSVVFVYACEDGGTFSEDCYFALWEVQ